MDRFYTPTSIANVLAAAVKGRPSSVADFAAGEGALLDAAFGRWPDAKLFASDIDSTAVAGLSRRYPGIHAQCADFLKEFPFPGAVFDLVLLNPPFSCRGNERLAARVGGVDVQCSRAMAFVCRSLDYLSAGGEILCILPASCISSEKDAAARAAISANYGVEVIEAKVSAPFDKCSVLVSLIRIGRFVPSNRQWHLPNVKMTDEYPELKAAITLGRGSTPVYKTRLAGATTGAIFAHTTDLRGGEFNASPARSKRQPDLLGESAILFPRVGRPSELKIVIVRNQTLVLSDCLFFIKSKSDLELKTLHEVIISHWGKLCLMYGGSCAPYISLSQVKQFIESLGYIVEIDRSKRSPVKQSTLLTSGEITSGGHIEASDQGSMWGIQRDSALCDAVVESKVRDPKSRQGRSVTLSA